MEIKKFSNGSALTVQLIGRLDAVTSFELNKELNSLLSGISDLTIDLNELDYISSAGLRILLKIQKRMINERGSMKLRNIRKEVREVLDMTGFSDLLTIEDEEKSTFSVSF